jgi:hypothetical protein
MGEERAKAMTAAACVPRPLLRLKMSSMEEENMLERLRLALLRECSQRLNTEPRLARDAFRRAFLESVSTNKRTYLKSLFTSIYVQKHS